MVKILYLGLYILVIVVIKLIFNVNFKEAKKLEKNENLQKITDRFPDNTEIAKEMLEIIGNKSVKIEEQKNTKTSLYIALTNKIIISDLKDNYGRIGTIAHECMHSVQDRVVLLFNFFYSNFVLVYWMFSIILIIFNVFTNLFLQISILSLLFFIQVIIRIYLEIDAMLKSKYLSSEYIEKKDICTKEEKKQLIDEYEKINNMGIRFYIYILMKSSLIKIIITIIISLIKEKLC